MKLLDSDTREVQDTSHPTMTKDTTGRLFLNFSFRRLRDLWHRVDCCLALLSDTQIWSRTAEYENSIGNLVLHLSGNVLQWILAGIGDDTDARHRDREFSARGGITGTDLREHLQESVNRAASTIEKLNVDRLSSRVVIGGDVLSALDAIYHVVEHFSMHTGQIIFMTKRMTEGALRFDYRRDMHSITDAPADEM